MSCVRLRGVFYHGTSHAYCEDASASRALGRRTLPRAPKAGWSRLVSSIHSFKTRYDLSRDDSSYGLRDVWLDYGASADRDAPWFELVEEVGTVEGVSLDGTETGVTDDAAKLLFGGAVAGSGGFNHILLKHHGTDIVAAESQSHLTNL